MKKLSFIFIAMLVTGYSHAALDMSKVYFGGGLGSNSVPGSSAGMGFQFFGGYDLPVKLGKGQLSVEAGYMDTGDMDSSQTVPIFPFPTVTVSTKASGLWATAVYSLPLQKNLNFVARSGLDIGDDDGLMFGAGVGYMLNRKMELRGEYVMRHKVDSLQVNFVMRM